MNDRNTEWRKSSYSNGSGGSNCVEVRTTAEHVLIRDSKDNGWRPALTFTKAEWQAFRLGVKDGEFDDI